MFNDLQARANITKIPFLPFNPLEKRIALTYIDGSNGKCYCVNKGVPEWCHYVSYANWSSMFELFISTSKLNFFGKPFHGFYTEKNSYGND